MSMSNITTTPVEFSLPVGAEGFKRVKGVKYEG